MRKFFHPRSGPEKVGFVVQWKPIFFGIVSPKVLFQLQHYLAITGKNVPITGTPIMIFSYL